MEIRGDPDDFMPVYASLPKGPLLSAINNVKTELQNDKVIGDHIRKTLIPRYYVVKHGVQTLYRVELPHFWRLIYALLTFENDERGALLLEVLIIMRMIEGLVIVSTYKYHTQKLYTFKCYIH